jgi:hypothetical protein
MGRKSVYSVNQFFGKLEVKEVLPSLGSGNHVRLRCLCHYCNNEKIISATNIKKRNSCGCQQRSSSEWRSVGPKTKPWQLPQGEAAKRNLMYQYRRGAERRNIEFFLTEEQFEKIVIGKCHYCGDELTNVIKGQGKTSGDFAYTGIDRLDSTKGYTLQNSVSCCWMCNNMKHVHSKEVFLNHIKKIYNKIK